jgi:hypothetical protein
MKKQCEINGIALELPKKRNREEVIPEPAQEALNINSKIEFAEKVKKVSHEILADIVKIVESDCKHALEDLDSERLQIKIDCLDKATFDKLLQVVNGYIDETKPVKKHKKNN